MVVVSIELASDTGKNIVCGVPEMLSGKDFSTCECRRSNSAASLASTDEDPIPADHSGCVEYRQYG